MSLGVAIVTGAARGIGRAVAIRLAQDGYDVALVDIEPQDELSSLRKEIEALGRRAIEVIGDVSEESVVEAMVARTVAELGSLEVMVANAGIGIVKPLVETTIKEWDLVFNVNAKGVFLCYKHAAKVMIERGKGGRIIGASSTAGKRAGATLSVYSATKSVVISLTQSSAEELKPYGVTVNAYAPAEAIIQNKVSIPGLQGLPVGQPQDVAAMVSYLASKDANFVTGQTFTVDGGVLLY
ncbi:hypothetical protein NP233_g2192 [Leucocoprinus birnbaumii]|uniref:Ketoreductase domain-containing protein n=1 Tax=Leucocoprinus birnbaumii TaxID=56174 RepID=A0AAD5YXF1_9AGAR|nr:hypothetical protein NP233_g2192 [Leucocoprinus birnbaumii]